MAWDKGQRHRSTHTDSVRETSPPKWKMNVLGRQGLINSPRSSLYIMNNYAKGQVCPLNTFVMHRSTCLKAVAGLQ